MQISLRYICTGYLQRWKYLYKFYLHESDDIDSLISPVNDLKKDEDT